MILVDTFIHRKKYWFISCYKMLSCSRRNYIGLYYFLVIFQCKWKFIICATGKPFRLWKILNQYETPWLVHLQGAGIAGILPLRKRLCAFYPHAVYLVLYYSWLYSEYKNVPVVNMINYCNVNILWENILNLVLNTIQA